MAELDTAGHGDRESQGATHSGIGAFNSLSDVLSEDRPNDHAVQDADAKPEVDGVDDSALVALDRAEQQLATISSLDGVLRALDELEAMRAVLRRVDRAQQVANRCAALRLHAQRRAGVLLRETERAKGGGDHRVHAVLGAPVSTVDGDHQVHAVHGVPTLDELGVTPRQSREWQQLAAIAPERFDRHIKDALEVGRELSLASVLDAHLPSGRPRKTRRTQSAPSTARKVKAAPPATPRTPKRDEAGEPGAATLQMGEGRISECPTDDDASEVDSLQDADRHPAEQLEDRDEDRPVRRRRTKSATGITRAVDGLLRDLHDLRVRALALHGDVLRHVLHEVETLVGVLSEQLDAEREAEPKSDSSPDSTTMDDAGRRWEEAE